jgi:sulfur-oxidizing protein SoxZ
VRRRGEVIEIRTLVAHPMESGHRADSERPAHPARHPAALRAAATTASWSSRPTCTPAISANPLIAFHTVATASGRLEFTWEGDKGFLKTESATIQVT